MELIIVIVIALLAAGFILLRYGKNILLVLFPKKGKKMKLGCGHCMNCPVSKCPGREKEETDKNEKKEK